MTFDKNSMKWYMRCKRLESKIAEFENKERLRRKKNLEAQHRFHARKKSLSGG